MVTALQLGPWNLPILWLTVCSFNRCLRASFTHISCGAHHFAHSKCKRSHAVTASLSLVNSAYRAILQTYSCHHNGRLPSVLWVCVICMHGSVHVHMISILFNEACSLLELGACLHGLVFRDSQSLLPEWAGNFRRATMTPGNCVGAGDLNLAPPILAQQALHPLCHLPSCPSGGLTALRMYCLPCPFIY